MRQRETAWPPRVLHVIDTLGLGGAERMAVELANTAYRRGWRAAVMATRALGPTQRKLKPGIPCVSLGRKFRFDLRFLPRLVRFEREFRPTILHIHGLSSAVFVAGVKMLRRLGCPALVHDHSNHTGDKFFPVMGRLLTNTLQHAVAVSRSTEAWARRSGFSEAKVQVIPNALDVEPIRSTAPATIETRLGRSIQHPCGIVVGRMHPQKGILTLLEAAERLPKNEPWSLLVVGGGLETEYGRACREKVRQSGLEDRFFFVGPIEDPVPLMKACDFSVIPSHSESGPLVLIEFLATELPVVATDVGENTRMAKEVEAIQCVPPRDPQALAEAVQRLLSMSQGERQSVGSAGWERTRGLFDMNLVFPRWEALYLEMSRS